MDLAGQQVLLLLQSCALLHRCDVQQTESMQVIKPIPLYLQQSAQVFQSYSYLYLQDLCLPHCDHLTD